MASRRDKLYHMRRSPERHGLDLDNPEDLRTYRNMLPDHDAWAGQKRRRNSTRKSNQKVKAMVRRIDRARRVEETRLEINK